MFVLLHRNFIRLHGYLRCFHHEPENFGKVLIDNRQMKVAPVQIKELF